MCDGLWNGWAFGASECRNPAAFFCNEAEFLHAGVFELSLGQTLSREVISPRQRVTMQKEKSSSLCGHGEA